MCFISSLGDKLLVRKLLFYSIIVCCSSKRKRVAGINYPLSPPLVSPEQSSFVGRRREYRLEGAMRIAPAEK